MQKTAFIFLISTACLLLAACEQEDEPVVSGPLYLQQIEIQRASNLEGSALPYSTSEGPRLFLRFGPFQGAFPAYQSRRSRQVTDLPISWGFAGDSILIQQEEEWVVALYEFNADQGEDLLFYQKLDVLQYSSPVSLTDTEEKFRIDLHYGPAED
jgi:hypothetical protein